MTAVPSSYFNYSYHEWQMDKPAAADYSSYSYNYNSYAYPTEGSYFSYSYSSDDTADAAKTDNYSYSYYNYSSYGDAKKDTYDYSYNYSSYAKNDDYATKFDYSADKKVADDYNSDYSPYQYYDYKYNKVDYFNPSYGNPGYDIKKYSDPSYSEDKKEDKATDYKYSDYKYTDYKYADYKYADDKYSDYKYSDYNSYSYADYMHGKYGKDYGSDYKSKWDLYDYPNVNDYNSTVVSITWRKSKIEQIEREYEEWINSVQHNTTAQDLASRIPQMIKSTRQAIQENAQSVLQPSIKALKAFFGTATVSPNCEYARYVWKILQGHSTYWAGRITNCQLEGIGYKSESWNKTEEADFAWRKLGRQIEDKLHDDIRAVSKDAQDLQTQWIAQDSKIAKEWGCSADCIDYCVKQGANFYFYWCDDRCGWTCPMPFKFNGGPLEHIFAATPLDAIQE